MAYISVEYLSVKLAPLNAYKFLENNNSHCSDISFLGGRLVWVLGLMVTTTAMQLDFILAVLMQY